MDIVACGELRTSWTLKKRGDAFVFIYKEGRSLSRTSAADMCRYIYSKASTSLIMRSDWLKSKQQTSPTLTLASQWS